MELPFKTRSDNANASYAGRKKTTPPKGRGKPLVLEFESRNCLQFAANENQADQTQAEENRGGGAVWNQVELGLDVFTIRTPEIHDLDFRT